MGCMSFRPTPWLPLACLLLLGMPPLLWLIHTWYAPGYEGIGFWAFAATVALLLRSVWSGPVAGNLHGAEIGVRSRVALLLLVSLLLRLAGTLAGVDLISALVLALDCYALALWLGTAHRPIAVAPAWLAVVFCFSLPLEPLVQRTAGFILQQGSAALTCTMFKLAGFAPVCDGVRLQLNAVDVLVDLPCSGARLASFAGLVFAGLAALRRPNLQAASTGLLLLLVLVVVGNALRIAVLALGIAYSAQLPIEIMAEPWHSLVGLAALLAVVAGLVAWSSRVQSQPVPSGLTAGPQGTPLKPQPSGLPTALAACVLASAAALPLLQPLGMDGSAADTVAAPATLPGYLGGYRSLPAPLGKLEASYFGRYGATAQRSSYGPHGLYVVRTRAPLRHLHAPEICLQGLGHRVEFLGTAYDGVARSRFRSIDAAGNRYRVDVSYVAADGTVASSIAEVIWHWFQAPDQHWTMIQRISPEQLASAAFERSVQRAFNLPTTHSL